MLPSTSGLPVFPKLWAYLCQFRKQKFHTSCLASLCFSGTLTPCSKFACAASELLKNLTQLPNVRRTLLCGGQLLHIWDTYLASVSVSSSSSARPDQSSVVAVGSISPIWVWSGIVARLLSKESRSRQKNSWIRKQYLCNLRHFGRFSSNYL